jgi:SAM-dependent methyltransferase
MKSRDDYAHKLYISDFLREPVIRDAIRELDLREGSRGLDAGCGIGSHLSLLAEQVGPAGHVTGLDKSSSHISIAEASARDSGLEERISVVEGDVNNLPFNDDEFDWIWSCDCVGYPTVADPAALLGKIKRVVRPGGTVAILGWSCQQLLPGYSLLEARLNTASSLVSAFLPEDGPESQFMRAPGWFHNAGFSDITGKAFTGSTQAPLSEKEKEALLFLFDMLWGGSQSRVSDEDWSTYQRISRRGSPDFILDRPDYYAFYTYVMFTGKAEV